MSLGDAPLLALGKGRSRFLRIRMRIAGFLSIVALSCTAAC
jgi:hypothetical protein